MQSSYFQKCPQTWYFKVLLAISLSMLSAYVSAMTPPGRWTEDAILHDGRVTNVEREVFENVREICLFCTAPRPPPSFNRHKLRFISPDTKSSNEWEGEDNFVPLLLDFVDRVPYLIVQGRPNLEAAKRYGCPELPFIYLKYESGNWRPVPVDAAPAILQKTNLTLDVHIISGDNLTYQDVRENINRTVQTSGGYFQTRVPRTYDEWNYSGKDEARNDRRTGDCRPPRVPPPPVSLPPPSPVEVEVLKVTEYEPDRIFAQEEWAPYAFFLKGEKSCKSSLVPADKDDRLMGRRFSADESGLKRVPYSVGFGSGPSVLELCDEHVWFISWTELQESTVISKYTLTGDLVYRVSFKNPNRIVGYRGSLRIPSLKSDAGYFHFEYQYLDDRWNIQKQKEGISQKDWYVRRVITMRFKEP